MKRNFTRILAAFALLVGLTIPMGMWGQTTVTYTQSSTTAVSVTDGTAPTGSSASFTTTYSNMNQLTAGNSMTLTLYGYQGKKITGITLSMKSNSSKGAGTLSVTAGSTTIASISPAANFNTSSWYGAWSTTYVDVNIAMSNTNYTIQANENVVITISATVNSLYCESFTFTYEDSTAPILDPCDLTLIDAPVELEFDLYNNSNAQTISYTTSSTGEVSVAQNDYITATVDQQNKTITVIPVAVTNGAKTIRVNQAPDENYASGFVEFTVDIEDSTPFSGGDVTFVAGTDMGSTTTTGPDSMTKQVVTISSTNAAFGYSDNYRMYKNSVTTVSTSSGVITSIAFTQSGNYSISYLTPDCGTLSDGTWTGSASSIVFTNNGTDQTRATQIVVTVNMSGTPDPVITANNVSIEFGATEGEITYTIANPVDGASLEAVVAAGATISNFELGTVGSSSIAFTCNANNTTTARTATVTLNYVKNSETMATKDVTITQAAAPETLTTMQAIFNKASNLGSNGGSVNVVFNNWVVSGVSGSTAFVTDNEGKGFMIFKSEHGFEVNDVLSGTVYGTTLKLYKGAAEFTTLTSQVEGLTITKNGNVTMQYENIENLGGVNTGVLITLSTLTYSSDDAMLTDNAGNSIKPYNTLYSGMLFTDGHTYDVSGIYQQFDNTKEILPRSAEDITEAQFSIYLNQPIYGNNTISADYEYAPAGTTVTLTAELEDGYTLFGWNVRAYVDGTQIEEIEVVDNRFVMPAYDVTVEALIAMPCTLRLYCNGGMIYETQDLSVLEEIPEEALWSCYAPEGYEVVGWTASPQTMELIEFPYPLTSDYVDLYSVLAESNPTSSALTIDANTENFPSSYGSETECMLNGRNFNVYQAYVNGQKLQFKASLGYIYNVEDFGKITSIVLNYNSSDTKKNFTITAGSAINPYDIQIEPTINELEYTFDLSDGDYHYFALRNGENAGYLNSIVINYGESGLFTEVIVMDETSTWYPLPSNTLEPWQRLVIKDGAFVQFHDSDMSNGTATNIIIEDGGQFISYNPIEATVRKSILGCSYNSNNNSGYYLIATPLTSNFSTISPYNVKGMLSNEYDLYAYDNREEYEWRNFKDSESYFTSMYLGEGYLYANSQDVTLEFAGSLTPAYDEESFTTQVQNPGFNLVGNPFTFNVSTTIDHMVLNSEGSGFEVSSGEIKPCEAILVETTLSDEEVTLSRQSRNISSVTMNVMKERGTVIDNARVRFGEGQGMNKFYLNENSTRIFIAQGNDEKAVAYSAAQGEMPVSFRASENGTYTIAVEAENVDMNYLHLIDNMTGADVDLLVTPNYTFEARTNDYTSRFRLVFSANGIDEQTAETFAFFNGTSWTVSNTGDATLQVVDITGRIVSSETITGNATVSLNQPAGIYMLRLVNGNDVKVQKVVVR